MILDLEIDNSEKYSKFERLGVNFMYIRDCEGLVQHKKDVQLHMLLNRSNINIIIGYNQLFIYILII